MIRVNHYSSICNKLKPPRQRMTYIVTFEIDNQIRKENFKNKLKEFEACCPIHDNAWAVYSV